MTAGRLVAGDRFLATSYRLQDTNPYAIPSPPVRNHRARWKLRFFPIEKLYKKKKRRQPPTETGEGSDVFLYLFYKRLPSGLQAKLINKFLSFALGTPIPGAHGIQELL